MDARRRSGARALIEARTKYSGTRGRLIPRRGQVKASIAAGLAQSLAALFSLAVARLV